ncbi:MAG TPA: type II toxin-antitoxin system antitoxin SocA domain-containing protein [Streptosporangiaceae bacterium]|nr:type II toxin-antitoxin system antitoxin SocA domain-containing protein [Streptosporangiaceae bacterium]
MAHVQDVAAYILKKMGTTSAMKLQKLCYFAYGYHLAWEERQLFPERFEAWANGPVCRPLYAMHRLQFSVSPGEIPGDASTLDEGERESVDLVLEGYGKFSAHQLSAMTHRAGPWADARRRAGAGPLDSSTEQLTDKDIFEYFDVLTSADANGREG